MANNEGLSATVEPPSALVDQPSDAAEDTTGGPSMLSRPIVAVPILVAVLVAGIVMVSSLDKVPVPPPVAEPADDEPTDTERAQETLQQLAELGLDDRIAYRSVRGVAVVDLSTGDVLEVDEFDSPAEDAELTLLTAADGSFVIDVADPTVIGQSAIEGDLYSTDVPGRFVAVLFGGVTGGDPEVDVRYAYALEGTFGVDALGLRLINGAEIERDAPVFGVPGLGAVVDAQDETFLFGANGYQSLTPYSLVAASPEARIEERCEPDCVRYYLRGFNGERGERELPAEFSDPAQISISPDGEWALVYNSLPQLGPTLVGEGVGAQLYEAATGRFLPVAIEGTGQPVWASDSSYVGWLDLDGNAAELALVFPADRSTAVLDLEALGAPDRDDVSLVFLGPGPE